MGFNDNTMKKAGLFTDVICNMSAKLKALMMKALEILAAVCHLCVCALSEVQKTNLDN